MKQPLSLFALFFMLAGISCAPQRAPVPPGVVPQQLEISAEDEQYGHQVLSALTEKYRLDRNDDRVNRVRAVVDRLTAAAGAGHNPWHVYVFEDDSFKNAAATKGNYIFIWSGMVNAVQSDEELAAVLAHEIGHLLAGHAQPDPAQEVNEILAGAAGVLARDVARSYGTYGMAASLIEALVSESVKGLIVNPENQRRELEADQVGLFLMADAGYDPRKAVDFWQRAQMDPALSGFPVEFMSSHPSSTNRASNLEIFLPEALARYQPHEVTDTPGSAKPAPPPEVTDTPGAAREALGRNDSRIGNWEVAGDWASLYDLPDVSSEVLIDLPARSIIRAESLGKDWLKVEEPVAGYVLRKDFRPAL